MGKRKAMEEQSHEQIAQWAVTKTWVQWCTASIEQTKETARSDQQNK